MTGLNGLHNSMIGISPSPSSNPKWRPQNRKLQYFKNILDINQCIFAPGMALDDAWATRCLELSRAVNRLKWFGSGLRIRSTVRLRARASGALGKLEGWFGYGELGRYTELYMVPYWITVMVSYREKLG